MPERKRNTSKLRQRVMECITGWRGVREFVETRKKQRVEMEPVTHVNVTKWVKC